MKQHFDITNAGWLCYGLLLGVLWSASAVCGCVLSATTGVPDVQVSVLRVDKAYLLRLS